jgi:hypothetical protein
MAAVPREPNRQRIAQRKTISFPKGVVFRAFAVLAFVTVAGGVTFSATTVALPKLFAERIPALAHAPSAVGVVVCIVYVLGASVPAHRWKCDRQVSPQNSIFPVSAFAGFVPHAWQNTRAPTGARRFTPFAPAILRRQRIGSTACCISAQGGGFIVLFEVLTAFGALVFLGAVFFPYRPDEVAPAKISPVTKQQAAAE